MDLFLNYFAYIMLIKRFIIIYQNNSNNDNDNEIPCKHACKVACDTLPGRGPRPYWFGYKNTNPFFFLSFEDYKRSAFSKNAKHLVIWGKLKCAYYQKKKNTYFVVSCILIQGAG